jgi:hypothetical protein
MRGCLHSSNQFLALIVIVVLSGGAYNAYGSYIFASNQIISTTVTSTAELRSGLNDHQGVAGVCLFVCPAPGATVFAINPSQATAGRGPFPPENTFTPFLSPANAGARADAVTLSDFSENGPTARVGSSVAEISSNATAGAEAAAFFFTRFVPLTGGMLSITLTGLPQVVGIADTGGASVAASIETDLALADLTDGSVTTLLPNDFNFSGTASAASTFTFGGHIVTGSARFFIPSSQIGDSFSLGLAVRASGATNALPTSIPEPPTLLLLVVAIVALTLSKLGRPTLCGLASHFLPLDYRDDSHHYFLPN